MTEAIQKEEETLGGHRFIPRPLINVLGVAVRLAVFLVPGLAAAQNEWLTWGYDQQRTGWNQSERVLTRDNASLLEVKWKAQLSTPPREEVLSKL